MKVEKWNDDYIWFTDGTTISYDHRQECCEYNWADFSILDVYYKGEEFDNFEIAPVNECGFILSLKLSNSDPWYGKFAWSQDYAPTKKILIPCYSDQNGYYSSDLTIIVHRPGRELITIYLDCQERLY